ncbi:FG-GAP-like repeat-containing protein [Streptomyces sp. NPDC014846]|uniref:FG-GAP-like repeat-containing protein n=1 Tax=Streptomyces sp. NPDC014846 TaxID=3364922 RepID=UPI0036FCC6C9
MSPRSTRAYTPFSLRRRAWLTAGAVVLSGAGIVSYAMADPPAQSDGKGQSRRPSVHTLRLEDRGTGRRGLGRRGTDRFSALLLTWNDADADAKGTPEVRTRDREDGSWSGWRKLPDDPYQADGAEAGRAGDVRGGTASLWTGDSDGVQVRLVKSDGTEAAGQPAGMDVRLLDPGTDPAGGTEPAAYAEGTTAPAATDTASPSDTSSPADPASASESASASASEPASEPASASDPASASASAPVSDSASASGSPSVTSSPSGTVPAPLPSTVAEPPVVTQAEWGASTDYDGTPSYGTEIKAAVIHHTGVDGDNKLSCADSRARMRTIQQEHFARGYFDIGYNFVVDRCGQIFEGRSGGMDLPVVGAHDIGFNTNTVGISYIGNYMTAHPSRAALDSIARIVAWKFGMYGIDPAGKVTLTSGSAKGQDGNLVDKDQQITLPRVFGHRDTNSTACPGDNLYRKLPLIATLASTPGVSHALPTADFDRDGLPDLVAGTPKGNSVTILPGGVDGPVTSRKVTLTQSSPGVPGSSESGDAFGTATAWGDVDGDGHADVAIGSPGEDDTTGHADRGQVTVMYGPAFTKGFSYTTSGGVTAAGAGLGSAVAVGDFDADGHADVFSAGTGRGGNWNVRPAAGATTSRTLTTATGSLSYLDATTGDFDRDGYADVVLTYRDSGGVSRVVRFAGSAKGLTKAGVLSVRGGRSVASADFDADGYDDLVIGQPYTAESGAHKGGQVTMLRGTSTGFTTTGATTLHQDSGGVPGAAESGDAMGSSVSAGDFDGDGHPDVLTGLPGEDLTRGGVNRSDAGAVLLLKGGATGLTGSGAVAVSQDTAGVPGSSESGDRLGSSVSLTDLSGYGRADLVFGGAGEDGGDGILMHLPSGSTGLGYPETTVFGRPALGTAPGAALGANLAP